MSAVLDTRLNLQELLLHEFFSNLDNVQSCAFPKIVRDTPKDQAGRTAQIPTYPSDEHLVPVLMDIKHGWIPSLGDKDTPPYETVSDSEVSDKSRYRALYTGFCH